MRSEGKIERPWCSNSGIKDIRDLLMPNFSSELQQPKYDCGSRSKCGGLASGVHKVHTVVIDKGGDRAPLHWSPGG